MALTRPARWLLSGLTDASLLGSWTGRFAGALEVTQFDGFRLLRTRPSRARALRSRPGGRAGAAWVREARQPGRGQPRAQLRRRRAAAALPARAQIDLRGLVLALGRGALRLRAQRLPRARAGALE